MRRFLVIHPYVGSGDAIVSRHATLRGALTARRVRETRWAYARGIIGIYGVGYGWISINGR